VNWLDILLAVILILTLVDGLKNGLARTGVGFAAVVAGLLCGLWFYRPVARSVWSFISSRSLADLAGFLTIFVGMIVFGGLLGALIAKLLKTIHLSWLDRLLGGAFGVLRGVLVCAVFVLILTAFSEKALPGSVANSRLAPYVMSTARVMVYAAPREFQEGFLRSYEKLREFWSDVTNKKPGRPEEQDL
jgi:membrane protein required for colicin V production